MKQEERFIYDTHEAIRSLTAAGMPEPQAEAVVRGQTHLIEYNLATKADIERLRQETKADIAAVQADVEKLRLETKADIAAVQANIEKLQLKTTADIAGVQASIEVAKNGLIRWMVGISIAGAGLLLATINLL